MLLRDHYKLCTDQYPTSDDMSGSTADSGHWIPGLLQMFMKELVSSSTKHTAFCQTIVQASRPRTAILLIPLPLTISIDNICGSSELIIESAWLGFCLSYDELLWFKHWTNFGINCTARWPQRLPPTEASVQYHIVRANCRHYAGVGLCLMQVSLSQQSVGRDSPMMDCSLSWQVKLLKFWM